MHLPQANAVSDGLTLMPSGRSWLCKAMLCGGSAVEELPKEQPLTEAQVSGAQIVRVAIDTHHHFVRVCTIDTIVSFVLFLA